MVSEEAGAVAIAVTVVGVTLNETEEILFEAPILLPDAEISELSVTTPHLADGEDAAVATLILFDENGEPLDDLQSSEFGIEVTNGASAGSVETGEKSGQYIFTVTSSTAGISEVSVTARGIELQDREKILFEAPPPTVSGTESKITATTPHLADGSDASTVTITVRDTDGELVPGLSPGEFTVDVTGSAETGEIEEAEAGIYRMSVVNMTVEIVTVSAAVSGIILNDQVKIEFQKVPDPVPAAPVITNVNQTEPGIELRWQTEDGPIVDHFLIYRGPEPGSLSLLAEVDAPATSFTDVEPNVNENTLFYSITAVNRDGVEGAGSDLASYYSSSITARPDQWWLVSQPLAGTLTAPDNTTLFSFDGRYRLAGTLLPTQGYWIKSKTFDSETVAFQGEALSMVEIELNAGWNLIGGISAPIATEKIEDLSGILTDTPVFGFNGTDYVAAGELLPGEGYWIFAEESGTVVLNLNTDTGEAMNVEAQLAEKEIPQDEARISFRSGSTVRELQIPNETITAVEEMRYLLPPLSPEPNLDVRTREDLSILRGYREELKITAEAYPVAVQLHHPDDKPDAAWRLIMSSDSEERSADLLPGRPVHIEKAYDTILIEQIGMSEVITEHALLPGYPNPFNPSTNIRYRLSEESRVSVEVFDISGRSVGVLADDVQEPGAYTVPFDATHLSSGIYLVRLIAGSTIQIQKITLIK